MAIGSIEFVSLLLLIASLYFYIPTIGGRRLFLSVCNLVFVAQFVSNVESAGFLVAFLIAGYAVGCRLRTHANPWLFAGYLVVIVWAFAVVQRYTVVEWFTLGSSWSSTVKIIGLSYMLFRQIHFNVDAMQGQIPHSSFWSYLNYQLNFLALVAGPIQRYQEFSHYWNNPVPVLQSKHEILKAYLRVFVGIVFVSGISRILLEAHTSIFAALAETDSRAAAAAPLRTTLKAIATFYLYPLYMYFNFAGYCDIVIGGAALIGLRLPENFDRPYLARNILDFWTRWHRTLGYWVRDYLFTPIYKWLAEWNPHKAAGLAFLSYFVAFVVMGVWHGAGLGFLIFGLLHGVGASSAKLWEMYLIARRGRKGLRDYLRSQRVRVIAIVGTLHYFAFSLLFFSKGLEKFLVPLRAVSSAWFAK